MEKNVHTGMNRTGMKASPIDAKALLEVQELQESAPAPSPTADEIRAAYQADADAVGTVPPPTSIKGVLGVAAEALTGHKMHILLDKMGERAAFERAGTRLYDAMLRKVSAAEHLPGGVTVAGLREIRDEEASHFLLLADAIEKLGADPTTQTPCADIAAVQGMGLLQAMNDPRVTIPQALQTLLDAELIDAASWELLIELARQFKQNELVDRFTVALEAENRHEATVKAWLSAAMAEVASVG
ncbi:ferritin-like domain-containing protein [Novilysobacter spongiicola]|uniref:Ferritin-like domain-containing protein n=1 Tax=Lysobacter spongiicola DSM 21749 TaxID=1122188 RepID=A0A1T4M7J0_9GAMM|nr:ferritin-like domain-containing protein [Lysobacter spongiicola]SJZ62973.1 Ferritin-like domain-containing protein [Lysobacter spongiicola DSM 21749]